MEVWDGKEEAGSIGRPVDPLSPHVLGAFVLGTFVAWTLGPDTDTLTETMRELL